MIDNALARAMSSFQIHADQRLKLMNFFVILLAGSLALFGSAIIGKNYLVEIVVGASIMVTTFVFKNLDIRTASLIKDAEKALNVLEGRMSGELVMDEIKLIAAAEIKKGILSYRQSYNVLFAMGYVLGSFGLAHGAWQYLKTWCWLWVQAV